MLFNTEKTTFTAPAFMASNTTYEEMLRAMEDARLPRYIIESFAELIGLRDDVEKAEAEASEAEEERDSHKETIEGYREQVSLLRERWDALASSITPEGGEDTPEMKEMEATVTALEEL